MAAGLSADLLRQDDGDLTITIYAEITEHGDLRVTGQDIGEAASVQGGDETEYTAHVDSKDKEQLLRLLMEQLPSPRPAVEDEHKDRLLLQVIKQLYAGNRNAVAEVYNLARANGIHAGWFRWP